MCKRINGGQLPKNVKCENPIAFLGYGALGVQVHRMIIDQYQESVKIHYFDDIAFAVGKSDTLPFSAWSDPEFKECNFVLGIGYKHMRKRTELVRSVLSSGRRMLKIVHKSCYVSQDAIIEDGSVLYPMVNIDNEVRIGKGVLLNNSVVVSHDSVIGDGCFLAPGVVISGNVKIGSGTFIGSGAIVSNDVTIGSNVVVGVASCVTRDIEADTFVIGNPIKSIKQGIILR